MQKNEVVTILREMADVLEVADAKVFEVMAYRNGAQALEEWSGDLDAAVSGARVTDIPSVGKGLGQLISDLVQSGASTELDRVRGLVPPELPTLLRVRGLGPKRVRALWIELGIESPDDLQRAAAEGRVQSLRGFGAKTVERILSGLEYLRKAPVRPTAAPEVASVRMPKAAQATGRIRAGTSGYSYPQWKGTFYPDDARTDDLLEHYAQRLATVEINNTFYRFPSEKVIQQWTTQTPAGFQFAVKAHRRITHQLRLGSSARDHITEFVQRCGQLGAKLGCILFQLPPDFSRDDARLDTLLHSLPSGPRYAVEFRHDSWFEDDIQEKLRTRNIACVSGDAEDQAPLQLVTADFVYTRLRRGRYSERDLEAWDEWFQMQTADKRDVLVYLKHDDEGNAPQAIVQRWAQVKVSSAREARGMQVAASSKTRAGKRRRKSG